jgi:outer membrane protein
MNLVRNGAFWALLLASVAVTARAQADAKIAVVDLQRALNETEDGRKAKGQLKKLFKQRQDILDKRQTEIKGMKDSIEKQRNVLQRNVLQKKLEDYQKAFVELQTKYVEYQRELAKKEAELTKVIIARMENILRRIGQAEGYTLIMERNESGVVWVPANLDLTDVVIQKYNGGEGRTVEAPLAGGKPARGAAKAVAPAAKAPAKPAPK